LPTYLANTIKVDLADLKSYKDYLNCTAYNPETLLVSLYATTNTSTELSDAQKNSLLFDYTLECVVRSEKYEAIPDLYRLDPS
jgi:hypothetical protein